MSFPCQLHSKKWYSHIFPPKSKKTDIFQNVGGGYLEFMRERDLKIQKKMKEKCQKC